MASTRGPFRAERGSVANALARCQFGAAAARARSARATVSKGLCLRRLRIAAIEADARPHQIEGIVACPAERRPTPPGWRARRQHGERGAEAVELHRGSSSRPARRRRPDGSSPAPDARCLEPRLRTRAARIDKFLAAAGPAGSCRCRYGSRRPASARRLARGGAPGRDLGQRIQHRRQAMRDQRRHRIGRRAVQHEDARLRHDAARSATPSSSRATKNVSQPAAASAGATGATPRP